MRSSSYIYFAFCFFQATAVFNKHFADFVEENYGKTFLDTLQRTDLGDVGSFGGKNSKKETIKHDPVIFVHGVSDIAGGKMQALAALYKKNGYTSGELYATTYESGPKNNPIAWAEYSLKCEHVKQIRTLILAVKYYTLRNVDIVAYSLGVPITRKAILGGLENCLFIITTYLKYTRTSGICVDTNEDLGSPLTNYVDTFIGVAGPNHGIALQVAGLAIPGCLIGAIPILPICSKVIGLFSGFCPTESEFLTDINKKRHYEGHHVYSLLTETDEWIGYQICDKVTARIPGEDGHKLYRKLSHDDIIMRTCDMQIQMMQNHTSQSDFYPTSRDGSRKSSRQRNRHGGLKIIIERPASSSEVASSEEFTTRYSSRSKKRDISEYDYLSELSETAFGIQPDSIERSSEVYKNRVFMLNTKAKVLSEKQFTTTTRSHKPYLPPKLNRVNFGPHPTYQINTTTTPTQSGDVSNKVGGYHTHVNLSFD